MANVEATHGIVTGSKVATKMGRSMASNANDERGVQLSVTDEGPGDATQVIYIYSILELRFDPVTQPPNFPRFQVPACKRGEKFAVTTIPRFIRNRYNKPGTNEYYYQREDGRKSANSLLNPNIHPASSWEMQFMELAADDLRISPDAAVCGLNSNLNAYGVFWSETAPHDPALERELGMAKERVLRTFKLLVEEGERLFAQGDRKNIGPRIHFAMDYLGLQAPWHQSTARMVACPNCGDLVRENTVYHKNFAGEKCIIDRARYNELFPPQDKVASEAEPEKKGKK